MYLLIFNSASIITDHATVELMHCSIWPMKKIDTLVFQVQELSVSENQKFSQNSSITVTFQMLYIGVGRGGARPPNNLSEGPTYPLDPNNPPTFSFNFYVKHEKNHKCTKLKGKIIINVTLI